MAHYWRASGLMVVMVWAVDGLTVASRGPQLRVRKTRPFGRQEPIRMMSASGGSTTSKFLSEVCPSVGAVVANAMFLTSLPAVLDARAAGALGALNPVPWAFILVNCVAWLHYSFVMKNKYAFLSNAFGAVLGLFFTLTGMQLGSPAQRAQIELVAIGFSAVHIFASFFSTFVLKTVKQRQMLTGYLANIILVIFYGAPLSTLAEVLSTKSAASIYAPLSAVSGFNGLLWVAYGLAVKDFFIAVPNFLGLVLACVQLGFKLVF